MMEGIASDDITDPVPFDKIYHIGFNQDYTSLVVGTEKGYKVFSWDNGVERVKLVCNNDVGNVILAERLFASSLMAIVTINCPRGMKLVHLKRNQHICDYLFTNVVLGVKLTRQRIIVCLEFRIIVHSVVDLKVVHEINNTPSNPKGLFAVSTCSTNTLVAYPGSKTEGLVQIFDAVHLQSVSLIRAHDSALAALAFDEAGTKLATASEKGTVIRIFDVRTKAKLQELRRGLKRNVQINSLSFALNASLLVVSSNTETVHIFKVMDPIPPPPAVEDVGVLGWLSSAVSTSAAYLPSPMTDMLQQERAYATVTLPFTEVKNVTAVTMICNEPFVLVAAVDGYLYIYKLNLLEGGECPLVKQQQLNFAFSQKAAFTEESLSINYARAVKGISPAGPLTETEQIRQITEAVQSVDLAAGEAERDADFPPF